ncbi:LacI family DNA-binding transcriptional regulator [Streptomyces sp. NPDC051776]|uniref:LacI family DNA-binding transcriptional regulator n=1 Tax=Streptomyces sp. NPDC051776 TaxID=3155414 RepID=UPI003423322A
MRVSLKDVAERAGVSIKTVSNVVNNYQHITPALRSRVQHAIDELGYRPNPTARHLRKGRTGIIGLALPELADPYYAELAGAVVDAAAEHDYTVLLDLTGGRRRQEAQVGQGFRARVTDGVILSPVELRPEDLRNRDDDAPLVLLAERRDDLPYDAVAIDNVAAARTAVRHLTGLGRRRVAFLGGHTDDAGHPAHLRLRGWREVLATQGFDAPDSLIVPTHGSGRSDGAAAMTRLLDAGEPPDAVLAYNDLIAIGAMRVLSERGVRVPEDTAVMGFDDMAEGRFGPVTLTTIAPDKRAIARLAIESILTRLENPDRAAQPPRRGQLRPEYRLMERESTLGKGRAPAGRNEPARE